MQHNGNHTADKLFYLHDRLSSVRLLIDTAGLVKNNYTYKPFGELLDSSQTVSNPFLFTGQWFDPEIGQYYLRARQYDLALFRFTTRDPFRGIFEEPMSLHTYLYCRNDSINTTDPTGLYTGHVCGFALASFGWSVSRQSCIAWDDKGNLAWINVSGIGAGSPNASAGVSFGFTTATDVFKLRGWGGDVGFSVNIPPIPFLSVGLDVIVGQGYWGLQLTPAGSVPKWIPVEVHGHFAYTEVYSLEFIRDILEESMYEIQTLGEEYIWLTTYGSLDMVP